jgi:ABC-type phosphate/phosphonate transport system ATPase subunit
VLVLTDHPAGLDAAAAKSIMTFLKELALAANIAIVCTIHQAGASTRPPFTST